MLSIPLNLIHPAFFSTVINSVFLAFCLCFIFLCECIVVLNASVICRDVFLSWQASGFQFCNNSIITFPAVSVFIKSGFISKAGLTAVVLFN